MKVEGGMEKKKQKEAKIQQKKLESKTWQRHLQELEKYHLGIVFFRV